MLNTWNLFVLGQQAYESKEPTHLIDKDGNVVVNAYTLNFSFGTGMVAKGIGILLNNEMSDLFC